MPKIFGKVAVLVVHSLDPGSINCKKFATVQVKLPTQNNKLAEDFSKGGAVYPSKVSDCFEVWLELAHHQMTSMLR
ncbi:hypothetical protein [Sulfitobacter sp.]|uniref:hypothetical protein n=1 Tax=Sulfitobacter sp. TaxID=1903071 RepID=UPI00300150E2